jgi:hypothetical protein
MVPKTQRLKVKNGPVQVDTSFLTNSLEGMGVSFLNSRSPRDLLAIALGALFAPCGAAEQGASIEEIEALIAETDRTVEYYRQLARTLAKRDGVIAEVTLKPEPAQIQTATSLPEPEPASENEPESKPELPTYTYVEEDDDL